MPQRSPSRGSSKPPVPMYALLLVLLIVGGGAILASLDPKEEPPPPALPETPRPFADLPPEKPPQRQATSTSSNRRRILAPAPANLESDAGWQQALQVGIEGQALYRAARAAKERDDRAELNEKGRQAKEKLNEALEMSAQWEELLMSTYGDGEPTVVRVMRTRGDWINALDWLLKSTSR